MGRWYASAAAKAPNPNEPQTPNRKRLKPKKCAADAPARLAFGPLAFGISRPLSLFTGEGLKNRPQVPMICLMIELIVSPWTLGLGIVVLSGYLAVLLLVRALDSAPDGFEDETGFHTTALAPQEDVRIWLQSRRTDGMMAECRPFPPSASSPTSRPVS